MRKKAGIAIITIIIFGLGVFAFSQDKIKRENNLGVKEDNKLLQYFISLYPDKEVLKCGYGDVDGDDRKDLVVIFNNSKRSNGMVVVLDKEGKYEITGELPAPIDNQKIEFKDIDETKPLEFIVSGSKDGQFGYAIFRVEGLEVKNLFGEGMRDCC
ncbi:Cys-Cys-COOH (seleno)protein SaoC [Tissierella creatinophila]|uniref:FG-GAP repeat protein n=1 Tax=Tissierella creatinophila DSM 6911 TaxID=1123403 RepID=A0A1U7M436_TISCR|nr:Cys-Cys-COOH (seleno)protein SaoC [Tissierella creatinophila]OLS02010.1 hypothetical protein TICRE_20280 [Tissierella creatinophila DSM 6911]